MARNRIRKRVKYCSMRCYQGSKQGAWKRCRVCKRKFYIPRVRKATAHYCSMRCYLPVTARRIRAIGVAHQGRHLTEKHRQKIGNAHRGPRHWNWAGGISKGRSKVWFTPEYQAWRRAVFRRDNYTCQICGARNPTMHADHKKPFALFPKLRYVVSNGRTLCVKCHRKTPTYGNPWQYKASRHRIKIEA